MCKISIAHTVTLHITFVLILLAYERVSVYVRVPNEIHQITYFSTIYICGDAQKRSALPMLTQFSSSQFSAFFFFLLNYLFFYPGFLTWQTGASGLSFPTQVKRCKHSQAEKEKPRPLLSFSLMAWLVKPTRWRDNTPSMFEFSFSYSLSTSSLSHKTTSRCPILSGVYLTNCPFRTCRETETFPPSRASGSRYSRGHEGGCSRPVWTVCRPVWSMQRVKALLVST